MSYSSPPYSKETVNTPNPLTFFQGLRASVPGQPFPAIGHESKESGEIFANVQRATWRGVFYVKGTPEETSLSSLMGGMTPGDPHPWQDQTGSQFAIFKSMYLVDMSLEYSYFGDDGDST